MGRSAIAVVLALALAGCGGGTTADPGGTGGPTGPTGPTGSTGPTGPAPLVPVAEGRAGPWTVQVQTDRTLGTGLVALSVRVAGADGIPVTDAVLAFEARRPASGLVAPVSNGPRPGTDGAYHLDLSLAEAASATDGWTFRIEVTRSGEVATGTFPGIAVVERDLAGKFAHGDRTIVLAVRFEAGLRIGSNPILVALHELAPVSGLPVPIGDATLHAVPYMPSMGHGSTGTVAPVPTATAGVYAGSLFFSMPGDWETTFTVTRAGSEIGRVAVTVVF
jgi:YtkA-like